MLEIVIGAWVVLMALLSLDHPRALPVEPEADAAGRARSACVPRRWPENARIAAVSLVISAVVVTGAGLVRHLSSWIGRATR